jgi:DNA polymerase-3 subunit epsilon
MREIVLDTETTGLDPYQGHRIVEIGCVELVNRIPSGATFHVDINPERDMPSEAEAVHGLTQKFLSDKQLFAEIADEFLAFLGDAKLVIHNAFFDLQFINAAVERCAIKRNPFHPFSSFDTATLAGVAFGQTVLSRAVAAAGFAWEEERAHSALYDAEQTALVFCEIVNRFRETYESSLAAAESG